MTTNTMTRTEAKDDVVHEMSIFGMSVIVALAALIGLWGVACLISGLATNGAGGMLKGLMTAIMGI